MVLDRSGGGPEEGHLRREHGEDVLFFDCVVDCEVVGELRYEVEEAAEGEVRWFLGGRAGGGEDGPGAAEVGVLRRRSFSWFVVGERCW